MGVFPQAERGFILMASDDGLFPLAAYRCRPGHSSAPTLSTTIQDRVLREGQAVLIKDVTQDEVLSDEGSVISTIRSAVCVPLWSNDGKPIGMIQLDRMGSHDSFQEQDLELLATLALPIGMVIMNERLLKEQASWAAAQGIQRALLPRARPAIPGYSFWECYRPAQCVGGDLYDYIPVGSAAESAGGQVRWAVTLGDVAGHGMPAALLMAGICPEVRHLVRDGVPAADVLAQVNRHVYDNGMDGRFVTLAISLIDPQTHELTVASAGHPPALLRRAGGRIDRVGDETAGMPLGVLREAEYSSSVATLEPGDVVVLYSDGIEAMNPKSQTLSFGRLCGHLLEAPAGVAATGESLLAAVRDHAAGRPQFDDLTIVCFGRDPC